MAEKQKISKKNLVGRIVGIVLVLGALVAMLAYEPPKPDLEKPDPIRPAKTLTVVSAGQVAARSYTGVVQASERVELSFRVAGPLVDVPVRRGMEVDEGDLVAQIDKRDFETALAKMTSELEQAEAQLKAMRAGERTEVIRMRENQLAAAKADYENARIEMQRHQQLLDEEVISQSEFDQKKLRADQAKEKVSAAEQDLKQAQEGARPEDIEAQEATVRGLEARKKEAADQLADTTLRAPFKGIIARQHVENLEFVQARQPIVSMQNIAVIEIVADVPETVLALVRRENIEKTTVHFDALPGRVFDVEFEEVEAVADARTQTYAVTMTMEAPEDVRVLPGMAATLVLQLKPDAEKVATGIPVPVSAVLADEANNPQIWRVDPSDLSVHRVPVEISEPSGSLVLVRKGLEAGDEIVTAGVHFLREGMQIRRLTAGNE